MRIRDITIDNFRSFDHITVALNDMNVLIGPNASGKSNFLDSFLFMKDCIEIGVENACLQRGDIDNILNKRTNKKTLSFNVNIDALRNEYDFFFYEKSIYFYRASSFEYFFELQKTTRAPRVCNERLNYNFDFLHIDAKKVLEPVELARFVRLSHLDRPRLSYNIMPKTRQSISLKAEIAITLPDTIKFNVDLSVINANKLLVKSSTDLDNPGINKAINAWEKEIGMSIFPGDTKKGAQLITEGLIIRRISSPRSIFSRLFAYDIDPKLVKESAPLTTLNRLASRGENLAPLIKYIYTKNKSLLREIYSILSTIIPLFEKFSVSYTDEKKLILKLKELGIKKAFPSYLMSDGTANITALLIALLYNKDETLICIEEPEKDIHPLILAKLVEVFRDVSENRQVIITTHSPELVKNLIPKEVLLIDRDDKGFTRIMRANQTKDIDTFLENFTLDELWLSGYLTVEQSN